MYKNHFAGKAFDIMFNQNSKANANFQVKRIFF